MFRTEVIEKIKTPILYSVTLIFENPAIYEIICKIIVEQGHATDHYIVWFMCIACCITKATNTHSECVIRIAFPRQHRLRERALILHVQPVVLQTVCKATEFSHTTYLGSVTQ
jgi:hypothetical protein